MKWREAMVKANEQEEVVASCDESSNQFPNIPSNPSGSTSQALLSFAAVADIPIEVVVNITLFHIVCIAGSVAALTNAAEKLLKLLFLF
ncbi:hypothetical protein PV327_008211 [Microctonus hyperodae]|uniref:Uncharacterized protein n=1 Tax=Microctonus hyperodae TaxID=165561 RepID=A0AA39F2N5_MICHY|nr:hypothetical protein PV327_008211 [Microctonus hyperodae]